MKIPDTQTVFHSYLSLQMIDDRMTSLDPVEEFMSVGQQRDISVLCLPYPVPFEGRVEEGGCSNSCAFIWAVASQEVRSYPVFWLCRKKVNALYVEKFQKSSYRSLMLKSMAVGPNIPPFSSEEWDEVHSLWG
ncbi:hypothetical protein ILYODFUR_036011 [Ilyodon furcidens]|uniref:Uncharacterized protein n=1 Tax=Ilyodon furcidens TaxID=33524 RepID=A0ABV0UCY8_9TELE